MRRYLNVFITSLILALSLGSHVGAIIAPTTWTANISTLPATMNTQNFNIQYDVNSIQPATFTASLYLSNDGGSTYSVAPCVVQDTNYDSNDVYGGSGTLKACISSDGSYSFKVVVTRDSSSDPAQSFTTSTLVDSSAPNPPSYAGKTVAGDTYTLTFTAPSSSDVSAVKIFASTATTYSANSSTQVGIVNVQPSHTYNFTYTAPNSTTLYFALQAFNTSGNGSTLVGDPGVVINPVITINTAPTTTASSAPAGQVLGASTSSSNSSGGQINAPGQSSSKSTRTGAKGKVLGASTIKVKLSNNRNWLIALAVIIAAIVLYIGYASRTGRNLLFKKNTSNK